MASPLARLLPRLFTTSVPPEMVTEFRPATVLLAMLPDLLTLTTFVLPDWNVRFPFIVSVPVVFGAPAAKEAPLPTATFPPITVPSPPSVWPDPKANEAGADTLSVPPAFTRISELPPNEEVAPTMIVWPLLMIVGPL